MVKSTNIVRRKRRGRPPSDPSGNALKVCNFRASKDEITRLDRWAKANGYRDRSAAIRAMIEAVLRSTRSSQR